MKTLLNILPPEKKKDLLLARWYRMIFSQEAGVLFLIFFLLVLLSGVWALLIFNERVVFRNFEEKKQKEISYADIALYEETFVRVQNLIPRVEDALLKQKVISPVLRVLQESVPDSTIVESVDISNGIMKVSGKSETREKLLDFQNQLKAQSCFTDATLPWSQMAQKEDVDFEITITVNPECFSANKS